METLSHLQLAATEIERTFQKYGLSYSQTRYVVQQARQALELKPKHGRTGTVERLSAEEAELFTDTAYRVGGQRGLMLKLLLETGARVSEFVQLRIDDISFTERLITIRKGKGGRRREVPITREMSELLRVYIGKRKTGYLFLSTRCSHFSVRRMEQIVSETAARAGIEKRVTPHKLRHSIATRLINQGMPVEQVRRFLGHESIKTTMIYAETETATLRRSFDRAMSRRPGDSRDRRR